MKIVKNLSGQTENKKPIWIMRQAGRYLPEYRALREKIKSFMEFCLKEEIVVEATLQPIARFDFDAAIIFSDILIVPHFLGQKVSFREGVGPVLDSPNWKKVLDAELHQDIGVVYQSIKSTRKILDPQKALIGFIGCPWTIASYMLNLGKTADFDSLINLAKTWPLFDKLIEKLTDVVAVHAISQLRAGADVVQLFESWALMVPFLLQEKWLFKPAEKIIKRIRKDLPKANIIYYGRGVAAEAIKALEKLNIGFGISENINLSTLAKTSSCLQGNLDPQKLLKGDFKEDIQTILQFSRNRPFIVNLGHGILPDTPISHVQEFIRLVKEFRDE